MTKEEKDAQLNQIVANLIMATAVGIHAHPDAKELLESLQDMIMMVMDITREDEWLKVHDEAIGTIMNQQLSAVKGDLGSKETH